MHKCRFCELLAISILLLQIEMIIFSVASQIQNGCSEDQFKCRNGDCIPATLMCDLKNDCMDGSDESFAACHDMNCTANKCSYGGCYSDEQYCNGHRDCWDGTDEFKFNCEKVHNQLMGDCNKEVYAEFQCQRSKECIRYTQLCDGTENCRDGSDESNELCVGKQCGKESFRCSYGACIARTAACDHNIDCRDSSDELAPICNKWNKKPLEIEWSIIRWQITNASVPNRPEIEILTTKTPDLLGNEESCSVPSSNNVIYLTSMYNAMPYINGNPVPHGMSVRLSCDKGYGLIGDDVNTCDKGKWRASWAECIKTCERHIIINDPSIEATCSFDGQVKDCAKDPLYVNTEVESNCATGYKNDDRSSGNQICDITGAWQRKPLSSPTFKCKPDCGKTFSTVQGHPWIVSIYKNTHNEVYEFMCLGTIIDPRYVITAASCFASRPPAHAILIVLGNHTIGFNKADENGFDTKTISHIYTGRNRTVILKMINPFKLSANIRPICLDNITQNLINNKTKDKVLPGTPLEYYNSTSQTYTLTHIANNKTNFIDLRDINDNLKQAIKRYEIKNRALN
ncbi:modular serine protease-like isoform X1 [Drosophila nasuta]|uniref:modular serine protease-like isoform X1 n=1 Tax=Drosophila nasuta TaxID=42062 RepID=UPI00295E3B16|nr:modular serine protease-like isoform X1 [Drosophila nasuta]